MPGCTCLPADGAGVKATPCYPQFCMHQLSSHTADVIAATSTAIAGKYQIMQYSAVTVVHISKQGAASSVKSARNRSDSANASAASAAQHLELVCAGNAHTVEGGLQPVIRPVLQRIANVHCTCEQQRAAVSPQAGSNWPAALLPLTAMKGCKQGQQPHPPLAEAP